MYQNYCRLCAAARFKGSPEELEKICAGDFQCMFSTLSGSDEESDSHHNEGSGSGHFEGSGSHEGSDLHHNEGSGSGHPKNFQKMYTEEMIKIVLGEDDEPFQCNEQNIPKSVDFTNGPSQSKFLTFRSALL